MKRWSVRLVLGVVVVAVVVIGLVQKGGDRDGGRDSGQEGVGGEPFTVAVVTRQAAEDRAGAARIALDELRALLRANKAQGDLPLEFVAVRARRGLTYEELRSAYPRIVAVIADAPSRELSRAPVPAIGTCRVENPPGLHYGYAHHVTPEVPEVAWQLRAYLAKKHHTRTMTVLGAWGSAKGIADQLGEGGPGPEVDVAKLNLPGVPVFTERPSLMSRGELRASLSDGSGQAVYLVGTLDLDKDLRALARAGFQGPVLYSTSVENNCGEPWDDPPERVPDGITLYRVDTVAPGAVRAKDCRTGNTERCPWLVRLPDRAGAVEEYEAAQALIRVYRTVWVNGRGTVPTDPEALADALGEQVDGQIVRGLSGWFEVGGPEGEGHTLGFGHDVWLHRWSGPGRWTNLGPVSAVY